MPHYPQLDGKRALIEVREGRRWHRIVVAMLKEDSDGLFAIFAEQYIKHYPEPAKVRVPDEHVAFFEPVKHPEYELRFKSILHRVVVESDDTVACARPLIIVTHEDIEAAKRNEG